MPEIDREAARLMVISPQRRVLLLRVEPTFRPAFWVTPGGGLDDGETFEHAAARELREEVGRDDLPIGPLLWEEHVEFTWEEWFVRQDERTFLVEAPEEFAPTIVEPGIEPLTGGAWFSVEDLRSMNEVAYPETLADRLDELLRRGAADRDQSEKADLDN